MSMFKMEALAVAMLFQKISFSHLLELKLNSMLTLNSKV